MPFIEIYGFESSPPVKARVAEAATEAVSVAYEIDPAIITVYILAFAGESYSHAGQPGSHGAQKRMFVKVFAFERPADKKRTLVRRLTDGVADACGFPAADIAVYIFDSRKGNVAHGGVLESDARAPGAGSARNTIAL